MEFLQQALANVGLEIKLKLEIIEFDIKHDVPVEDVACYVYNNQKLLDVCVFMGLEQIVTIIFSNAGESVRLVLQNIKTKHIYGTVSILLSTFANLHPSVVYEHWVSLFDKTSLDIYRGTLCSD